MAERQETEICCPYCWETVSVLLDPEDAGAEYIEDCQVCCRPIEFRVVQDGMGWLSAEVRSDNDA